MIKTELEIEEDIYSISVIADETRLKQILLNLVSNAVKFTKSGYIIIKCHKHPEKELVLISIIDTGSGIKDENQNRIFIDYFIESEGYRNNSYGTGIGLSICKNIAFRMNMDIKFKSKLGEGTEFNIEIPIKENKWNNGKIKIISEIENSDIIKNTDLQELSMSLSITVFIIIN